MCQGSLAQPVRDFLTSQGKRGAYLKVDLRHRVLMTSQSALLRQEAPCCTSRSTASKCPPAEADWTAVQDLELRILGSADATSKASTASLCPAMNGEFLRQGCFGALA